jgi:hypothetical protein
MGHKDHAAPGTQILWVTVGDDVKAIIEGITDSGPTKPYIVYLQAGIYNIGDNTIAVPTYVNVVGNGSATLDYTGNLLTNAITMGTGSRLTGVTIQNHLSSSYAIQFNNAGAFVLDDVVFLNCTSGVIVNNTGASVTIRSITLLPFAQPMTTGVRCSSGSCIVRGLTVGGAQALTNIMWADSADAIIHCIDFISVNNPSVVNAIYASNGAQIEGDSFEVFDATRGVYALSGGKIRLGSGKFQGCTYGVYCDGSGTELGGYGMVIRDSITNDVWAGANTKLYGMGLADSSTFNIDPSSVFLVSFLDIFEGDEGLAISAEIHSGTPSRGREGCFGEGDSYVNGMLVYTYNGTVYADVTAQAQSPSGSTFTFPNNNVNSAIYVGSAVALSAGGYHKFFGMKMLSTTAQVGGTIVAEYWNGSAWTAFNTNTVESSGAYDRKASGLFEETPDSYQVFFDPRIEDDWAVSDDPSVGTSYYWVRFRITLTLTTAPVFQQFKCHSNRHEINADGYNEYFGTARSWRAVNFPWNAFGEAGAAMADQDLWYTTNCRTGLSSNNFNSDGDSVGTVFALPSWVDTSAPLRVRAVLVSSTTGTLQMIAWLNRSQDGDTISTTDPVTTTGEQSVTVSKSVTAGQQVTYEFELDISDYGVEGPGLLPDVLWLNLEADSRPGNVYGALFQVELLQNRLGRHIKI